MISGTHVATQEQEMEQMHTEEIHSKINQFVTIRFSNAVLAMLCFGVSIGTILLFALADTRTTALIFAFLGLISVLAGFGILKKSQKLSSGKEIHISND